MEGISETPLRLRKLLADVDPSWYSGVDQTLLRSARDSALGRQLLGHWLAADYAAVLLAPKPAAEFATAARVWQRQRLQPLCRDLGTLAYAPAIRSDVKRSSVLFFKHILGNGYLLALDPSVWDGKVDVASGLLLTDALQSALASDHADLAFTTLLDAQGRAELRGWARNRDPALAEWLILSYPPEPDLKRYLPEKQVLRLQLHHQSNA
jgi:hypothetical protein